MAQPGFAYRDVGDIRERERESIGDFTMEAMI